MTAVLGSAVAAALALVHLLLLVPRLAEPAAGDAEPSVMAFKPRYRDLATPARAAVLVPVAMACGALSAGAPTWGRGLWWVWAGAVLTLAAVDQATTFLPRQMWYWCAAEGLLALLVGCLLAGPGLRDLAVAGVLTVATPLPFWLAWRLSGAIGFGDVRLAAGTGLTGAVLGVSGWAGSLLAATLAGAVLAIGVSLWRRFRPSPWGKVFAYGPALWIGPWLALIWTGL